MKNKEEFRDQYQFLDETYPGVISADKGEEDEHFIVWMRVASLPNFRKLYGKIEDDLDKHTTIHIKVESSEYSISWPETR